MPMCFNRCDFPSDDGGPCRCEMDARRERAAASQADSAPATAAESSQRPCESKAVGLREMTIGQEAVAQLDSLLVSGSKCELTPKEVPPVDEAKKAEALRSHAAGAGRSTVEIVGELRSRQLFATALRCEWMRLQGCPFDEIADSLQRSPPDDPVEERRQLKATEEMTQPTAAASEWPADAPEDAVAITQDANGKMLLVRLVHRGDSWCSAWDRYHGPQPASWAGKPWTERVLHKPGGVTVGNGRED